MTRAMVGGCGGAMLALALATAPMAPGPAAADETKSAKIEALAVADAAAADTGGLTVRVARGPAGLEVEGRCVVYAPVAVVWEVLTDYDGIDGFVSSMRESRIAGRGDHHVLVEQLAVGRLLLFSRRFRVTLFVEETPRTSIRFEDVLGRDFESYRGEWRIEEDGARVTIVYQLGARPSFSIPDFVARRSFKSTARELLSQVRAEIERRAELKGRTGDDPPRVDAELDVEGERPGS